MRTCVCHLETRIIISVYWATCKAFGKVMLYSDHTEGCFLTVGDLSTR